IELLQYSANDAGWRENEAALVIAAPLKAEHVANWASLQSATFSKCLDLRGEAETDPISDPVIKLHELFDALRSERQRLESHVEAARAEINQLVQRQNEK